MKHLPRLYAAVPFLIGMSVQASAGSTDLRVDGSITPAAACDVVIGSSTLNLGTIDRTTLNSDSSLPTDLKERTVRTSVACPDARRFAFVVAEARGNDTGQPFAFNMHDVAREAKAGHLFLLFDTQSTKINGKQGYATGSSDGVGDLEHATWGPATPLSENLPIPNGLYAVGFVKNAESTDAPVPMETLSVDLLVRPRIKPVNDLDLSGDIAFSSDIGLEIRYF